MSTITTEQRTRWRVRAKNPEAYENPKPAHSVLQRAAMDRSAAFSKLCKLSVGYIHDPCVSVRSASKAQKVAEIMVSVGYVGVTIEEHADRIVRTKLN